MPNTTLRYLLALTLTAVTAWHAGADEPVSKQFLSRYCYACHGPEKQKGDLRLDTASRDLSESDTAFLWEDVLEQIESGEMPPKKADRHPTQKDIHRATRSLVTALDEARAAAQVGGTVLRRLNRVEYENTVSELFGINFKAPLSFPEDQPYHGFDNLGEGLVLSPPLMQQYFEIATQVADQVIPPAETNAPAPTRTVEITPDDLSISFSTGAVMDGAMRIVSKSDPMARSCTWPIRFEAKRPGHYRVNLTLSKFRPWDNEPMMLEVRARNNNDTSFGAIHDQRKLVEFAIDSSSPTEYTADVELYAGETLVFYYRNAPLDSDNNPEDKAALEKIVRDLFKRDPRLHAAWLKTGMPRGFRGCGSWHQLQELKQSPDLDLSTADPDSKATEDLIKLILRNTVASVEAIACGHFETGPGLDIHHARVTGPLPLAGKVAVVKPDELTATDYTGVFVDGRFRMISSQNVVARSCVWPRRYEAKVSGRYVVSVDAGTFQSSESRYPYRQKPYRLELYAMDAAANTYMPMDMVRPMVTFDVPPGSTETYTAEVELYRGQTVVFRWGDSPMYSIPPEKIIAVKAFHDRLKNKRLYAAWLKIGADRGATEARYYEKLEAARRSDDLDLSDPRLDTLPKAFPGDKHNQLKRYFHEELRRFGPALEIAGATIRGPVALIEDDEMRKQRLVTERFMGQRNGQEDRAYAERVLRPFLTSAFRRPVSDERLGQYVDLALQHTAEGRRFEDGLHLAIRTALTSPGFLYRSLSPGKLDGYDLAQRLSYFLWNGPPDERLTGLAESGQLENPEVLAAETRRLLESSRSNRFVESFTGQWLGTRTLEQIMPDERLLKFDDRDRQAMTDETEMFFLEILNKNLPVETFIDPDFTYLNDRLVKNIYQLKGV
ncbi:MAG: DUF1592 domain-containing protein, partial [Planctomycetota bacterium]